MKRKKFFLYLPTWIFCAFIFTFMIRLIVLPKESFSEKEKRSLAEFPELNTETLLNGNFQNNLVFVRPDGTTLLDDLKQAFEAAEA